MNRLNLWKARLINVHGEEQGRVLTLGWEEADLVARAPHVNMTSFSPSGQPATHRDNGQPPRTRRIQMTDQGVWSAPPVTLALFFYYYSVAAFFKNVDAVDRQKKQPALLD